MTAERREAERQSALLQALAAPRADATTLHFGETPDRAQRGLQAYRANAQASAERALASAFPTVQALIGAGDFAHLAREHWLAQPATCGDLGEWGGAFPDWLAAHAAFAEWPYLGDCARVDLAVHRCERAADSAFDAASLHRLGDTELHRLRLVLADGLALVESSWPIAAIHVAHRRDDEAGYAQARDAIAAQRAEAVVIARDGYRAVVTLVDAATGAWLRVLLQSPGLAAALDTTGEGFDFAAWLVTALRRGWLKEVAVIPD